MFSLTYRALVRHLSRRALAHGGADRILVTIAEENGGFIATATYHLTVDDVNDSRPILFDLTNCPLKLQSVDGIGVVVRSPGHGPGRPAILTVDRDCLGTWENTSVALTFRWPYETGDNAPTCLVVPDLFPLPIHAEEVSPRAFRQPLIETFAADLDHRILAAGIARNPIGNTPEQNAQLQAVLLHPLSSDSRGTVHAYEEAIFSPAMSRQLGEKLCAGIAAAIRDCLHGLSLEFGVVPWTRLLVASVSEFGRSVSVPHGAVLTTIPRSIVAGEGLGPTSAAELSRSLGEVWWGGGCKMYGPREIELRHGLTYGIALQILEKMTSRTAVEQTVEWHRRSSWTRRLRDTSARLRGHGSPHIAMSIATAIYEWLRDRSDGHANLQALTRESWGMMMPTFEVARRLGKFGVALPDAFDGKTNTRESR